ncbi:ComEA family DNA-binding protein [Actinomadura sp. NBRC 104425]|uniref:ComEA family DNA-binding protein n=1 Tax=Actinomadura sp. NBRC 104425 TaxID=3032204 RepID=UPI002552BAA9|nr:ComEA family DNA-binding protein [Actinomadura sp. NBRC 104425]
MLGRLDPGAGGVRALAIVALAAALVAAGYLWLARPRPVAQAHGRPTLVAGSSVPATAPASGRGAPVMVHVYGKVRRPGVVTLPGGSRVADAIKAAGGVRPGADTGALNLARKVVDGEQIPVGVRAPSATPAPDATPAGAVGPSTAGAQLDLNTASVDQLDQLPGVGPVLAQRIVDYRTRHGGFRSVEQLQEVSGIGERRFADLKNLVRV